MVFISTYKHIYMHLSVCGKTLLHPKQSGPVGYHNFQFKAQPLFMGKRCSVVFIQCILPKSVG